MVLGSTALPGMVLTTSSGAIPVSNVFLNSGNAWCTTDQDINQILHIDFGQEMRVHGLAVQGDPTSDRWMKNFGLEYANRTQMFQTYPAIGIAKVCILILPLY